MHAAGPGHGKSLVAALVVGGRIRPPTAVLVSIGIALGHGLSGIIVAALTAKLMGPDQLSMFSQGEHHTILMRISGVTIIALGLVLCAHWLRELRSPPVSESSEARQGISLLTALVAGIIPCPGTIFVYLLATATASQSVAILAAVAQILGMVSLVAIVGLVTSAFGMQLQRRSGNPLINRIHHTLEGGATMAIVVLGALLFISTLT